MTKRDFIRYTHIEDHDVDILIENIKLHFGDKVNECDIYSLISKHMSYSVQTDKEILSMLNLFRRHNQIIPVDFISFLNTMAVLSNKGFEEIEIFHLMSHSFSQS